MLLTVTATLPCLPLITDKIEPLVQSPHAPTTQPPHYASVWNSRLAPGCVHIMDPWFSHLSSAPTAPHRTSPLVYLSHPCVLSKFAKHVPSSSLLQVSSILFKPKSYLLCENQRLEAIFPSFKLLETAFLILTWK